MTVRELNGWSPASVTVDGQGRVVSVTVTEPRFTVEDKAVLLASFRESRVLRNSLGIPLVEATDDANKKKYRVKVPPRADHAETALRNAQKAWSDEYKDDALVRVWELEQD